MNTKNLLPILAMMAMAAPMSGKHYDDDSEYTPLTDEQKVKLPAIRKYNKKIKN